MYPFLTVCDQPSVAYIFSKTYKNKIWEMALSVNTTFAAKKKNPSQRATTKL